jgi:pyridoxal phosphate enzyme (YggS family)
MDKILQQIEKARLEVSNYHIVQLVAISKYVTSKEIAKLYAKGQRAFGENKIQDLKQKSQELANLPISWHFVGTLQTNKINNLIDLNPILFHSLHSFKLALKLDEKLKAKGKKMNVLLQINSANEDTKSGVDPQDAIDIYHQIQKQCKNINLKGVMSIGANSKNKEIVKQSFLITKNIFDKCNNATICSMGMSSDFQLAIKCGSNMLRLGSILFNTCK